MENGLGQVYCQVIGDNSIFVADESQHFTFDHVFATDSKQEDIYGKIGKDTVADVLHGYNGTIFAYGQSGSGKTYTMFGPDIFDQELKGIIPRAAADIFRIWDISPDVKEVEIRCSMLEIYMERLRDLLTDEAVDLKVKQSPSRGIYVEGLSEFTLESEEELMYYIDMGEQRRVWAETRHNVVSSRSHTIFVIEVRQVFANGTEWRGLLNLVDLAGSEKLGKTGAQGQVFEEGTKINLSLSALGNVIHSLSLGLDHVPYRESKLTRLLQESLGGNYKTSLVVTCSPHSSQKEETLSALKFAQRAKKLRNSVRVNVKNSSDGLMKMIEQLKGELAEKDATIQRLIGDEGGRDRTSLQAFTEGRVPLKRGTCGSPFSAEAESNCDFDRPSAEGTFPTPEEDPEEYEKRKKLAVQLSELTARIETLTGEKAKLERRVREAETELLKERKRALAAEEEAGRLSLEIERRDAEGKRAAANTEHQSLLAKVYESQLKALTEALEDSDAECAKLLKEKKAKLRKDTVDVCDMSLPDYMGLGRTQTLVNANLKTIA